MNTILPKIAIIGYGAMGKNIENIAQSHNIEVSDIFDINNPVNPDKHYDFDVAIDFSYPDAVLKNAEILAKQNKNIVIGTTGWYGRMPELSNICEIHKNGIIYSSNFSIGMQIFFKIVENAMQYIDKFHSFDVFINETHHQNKVDSPSGTAKSLSEIVINNSKIKDIMLAENINRKIEPNELHVTATRGGSIFGKHTVFFDSPEETIELSHNAKNRNGFAEGAIYAAKWIYNKTGLYNFNELFLINLQ